jgi:tyrosinase
MPHTVTSHAIDTAALDRNFTRADVQFDGLDHSGASYQGRVFLNTPGADETTPLSGPAYAGSYYIFGHGGCLGDVGHCDVKPRHPFDPRPAHPLTPTRKVVIATDAVRAALDAGGELTVTVVPVILSTTPHVGRPDDLVKYELVRVITYR